MPAGVCKRMHVAARAFRAWPIWGLPRGLAAYIVVITTVYAVALGVAARTVHVGPWGLFVFAALMLCIASTVELTKRSGENAGVIKDVYAVWELPIAILLPPVFALLAPLIRIGLTQWRIRRIPLHRRVLTASAVGLSYGLASVGFRAIGHLVAGPGRSSTWPATPTLRWLRGCWPSLPPPCSSGRPTWPWCCPRSRLPTRACGCGT